MYLYLHFEICYVSGDARGLFRATGTAFVDFVASPNTPIFGIVIEIKLALTHLIADLYDMDFFLISDN